MNNESDFAVFVPIVQTFQWWMSVAYSSLTI